jgi:carbamoyl-phosphate synthase large subunit
MPRRDDIRRILVVGSGPIVIGQACEFDYSGTQAVRALRAVGYEVVLVNSNPATIMTDPELAELTYIEPLTVEALEAVIRDAKPDALLSTLGGQTALNLSMELAELGVLEKYGVKMLGANAEVIARAEDRELFKETMRAHGLELPSSGFARTMDQGWAVLEQVGFPAIIRPSFTLGGTGGGIAYNRTEFERIVRWGIELSPVNQVLIEESLLGWKEFELELMRDHADNAVVICSIENVDPMGVHTGDSITVAPVQTLTDREYQEMRDDALTVIRAIGVEAGGCNIQFAVDPKTGRRVVIEMNPRVSRSSALASKATGFPIAKMAALLAVGFRLDEIENDITRKTPACFEPVIDYCVVKVPRFAFEKFVGADRRLTTQMKSVGEVMSIGRSFSEALLKAFRSLEIGRDGLNPLLAPPGESNVPRGHDNLYEFFRDHLHVPTPDRLWYVADALGSGLSIAEINELSGIDRWFLDQILQIVEKEEELKSWRRRGEPLASEEGARQLWESKRLGMSDVAIARILRREEDEIRAARKAAGIAPVYKKVDTCAAEFEAVTPYLYSTYQEEDEVVVGEPERVIILGGGPNRIGQGVEFDYCAVHGVLALNELGFETVMINCNPETVSTDYDLPTRLYFEPLTFEDVIEVIEREKPRGVILQFGGQTPLNLGQRLLDAGVPILGTSPETIDMVEDRERFYDVLDKLGLKHPEGGTAYTYVQAEALAAEFGYPLLLRPSYVLGGRAMQIVRDGSELEGFFEIARAESKSGPVLLDRFLDDAIEVDVDCIADGETCVVAGIMEHIEEAGVHSGDSACALPPYSLAAEQVAEIERQAQALAAELGVVGLMNIQFAIQQGVIYILEVNPRASRTIPFVSKAIGHPLAKYAARVMVGQRLKDIGFTEPVTLSYYAVKEAVFPFRKFDGVEPLLGPEMRSTGEVMGIDRRFHDAFFKAQEAASNALPKSGTVFMSVRDDDKHEAAPVAADLVAAGLRVVATGGTRERLREAGIACDLVKKVKEGRPHIVDMIINGEIQMVINTTVSKQSILDSHSIRHETVRAGVPYFTTMAAARVAARALAERRDEPFTVRAIQSYHEELAANRKGDAR